MVYILNRLFFVVMFSLLVSGIYSVGLGVESYAGGKNGTTGGGPTISDDGSSADESPDDGSSDGNSGAKKPKKPKKSKKPKKQWLTDGNADINSSQNFLGTTDDADLVIKTNDTEKIRVTIDGNVGIGTDSPTGTLHVEGGSADSDTDGKDITLHAQDGGQTGGAGGNILLIPGASGDGFAPAGKVLVGTDSSILSLDVNGVIRIRGGAPWEGWVLTALDSNGTAVWQALDINDADADPANELQTLSQSGNSVTLSNGGGSITVADNDDDSSNEIQALSRQSGSNDVVLSNGGGTVSVVDDDNNSTNELNTGVSLNGSSLEITDSGGTIAVDIGSLVNDADADPENEIQALSRTASSNDISLSNGGGTVSVADNDNDSSNEIQDLSSTATGTDRTIGISGGIDTTINVADNDNDSSNENNTAVTLNGTSLEVADTGGILSADLVSLRDDADADPANELQVLSKAGTDVTLTHGGGTVSIADNDNNSANELQTMIQAGNDVTLSNGGGSISVADGDSSSTNELNTGVALAGTSLDITDAGNTLSVDLVSLRDDADADPVNEIQTLSKTGTDVTLTNGGTVSIADNDNDITNEINTSADLTGTDLNISDPAGTLTVDLSSLKEETDPTVLASVKDGIDWTEVTNIPTDLADGDQVVDADANPANEIQTLSKTGTEVTLTSGGTVSIADNDNDSGNELNTSVVLNGTSLDVTDSGGILSADLSSLNSGLDSTDDAWEIGTTPGDVTTTGKVGIGITNPTQALDVAGNVRLAGDLLPDVDSTRSLGSASNKWKELHVSGSTIFIGSSSISVDGNDLTFNDGASSTNLTDMNTLQEADGGGTALTVDNNGNVGIGTVTPGTKLEVAGQVKITGGSPDSGKVLTSDADGLATWETLSTADFSNGGEAGTADRTLGNSDNFDLGFLTNGTNRFHIQNDGKVGIGTTNPSKKLEVNGNIKANRLYLDGGGSPGMLLLKSNNIGPYMYGGASGLIINADSGITDRKITLSTSASATPGGIIHMSSSGIVGIGTVSPDINAKLEVAGQVKITGGTPGLGKVLTSDGDGLATWKAAASGGDPSYGSSAASPNDVVYVDDSGKVGIGTTTPEFKLSLDDDGGIVAKGTYLSGADLTASGAGTRLIWYPKKAAFRAGQVNGFQWDDANVGDNSIAMGNRTTASGDTSTAMGITTTASGPSSTAMGNSTRASGSASTAMGGGTKASGGSSTAMGSRTTASGDISTAMGSSTTASGRYSTAMGITTRAIGDSSTSMGNRTTASGETSIAMGRGIEAQGINTVAIALNDQTGTVVSQDNTMAIMGGNVGIGTASPAEKLMVNGAIGTNGILAAEASGNYETGAFLDYNGLGARISSFGPTPSEIGTIRFVTASSIGAGVTVPMNISSTGNVRIGGGAPSLDAKLEVAGQVKITGGTPGLGKVLTSDASGLAKWEVVAGGGLWSGTAGSDISYSGGKVGIGTTSPLYPLDVRSAPALGSSQMTAISNSSTNTSYGGFLAVSTAGRGLYMNVGDLNVAGPNYFAHAGDATIGATANAKLHLRAGATDVGGITIATNGDVGIGKTNPQSKLDVAGEIKGFGVVPIGSIIAWHKNIAGVPALADGWVECNGQTLSDAQSSLNGQVVPNLNGQQRFLRGNSNSGIEQGDTFRSHGHAAVSSVNGNHAHSGTTGFGNAAQYNLVYNVGESTINNHIVGFRGNLGSSGFQTNTNYPGRAHTHSFSTNTTGNHGHSVTVLNQGGAETRPVNMSVVWVMRVK